MKDLSKLIFTCCFIALGWFIQAMAQDAATISSTDAHEYMGDTTWVTGTVTQATLNTKSKGTPAYLNFGEPYPNHHFTIVIWTEQFPAFDAAKLKTYEGKKVKIYGIIKEYRGKPQIVYGPEVRIEVLE